MAAIAYFRFEENGVMECALVGSKTKVAPLTFTSIPRLELQAAVLGARLASAKKALHRLHIAREVFWTDSKTVMCWINADHRRYSQFVAVRVSELVETTKAADWNWISTKANVADEGTKCQKLPDLSPHSRWYRRPGFLWKPSSEWPDTTVQLRETEEEVRRHLLHHTFNEPVVNFTRFSKWKRLLRAVAYVYRFIHNSRSGTSREARRTGALTQEELQGAEHAIYRQVQRDEYADDIRSLNDRELQKHP